MKMRYRLLQLIACSALLIAGDTKLGFAQETQCLNLVRNAVQSPGVWRAFTDYIATLSIADEATKRRSRLIRLRADIIILESAKTKLVEILEAHIDGGASGVLTSDDLRLSGIPNVLAQIESISHVLMLIAQDGDLFAAENSFKNLVVILDAKRVTTLCNLQQQTASPAPDLLVMKTIVQQLNEELIAISAAEEALGKYIKESNN